MAALFQAAKEGQVGEANRNIRGQRSIVGEEQEIHRGGPGLGDSATI
jgi:hypothetical protein